MLASFRQTYRLATVQKMGARGDDRLAGLQRAGHPRGFIIRPSTVTGCRRRWPDERQCARRRGRYPDRRPTPGTASTGRRWSLPMRRVTVDPSGAFASAPFST